MPETIKQFTNEVITATSLSSDGSTLPIFTNNGSTTRVLRDIQVQDSDILPAEATLEVGGTTVADSFENSTGTLVVPPSASLDIKLTTPVVPATKLSLTMRHNKFVSNSQTDFTPITGYEQKGTVDSRFPYDYSGVTFNTTTTTGTAEDFVPPFDTNALSSVNRRVNFIQIPSEKTYYYFEVDDNSTSDFGKYVYTGTGGPGDTSASHTTLTSNTYAGPAIDWQGSRMFIKEGTNIKEYNLLRSGGINNSTADVTHSTFVSTQSSHGTGAYCNNHYAYGYNGTIYIRNLAVASGWGQNTIGQSSSYPRLILLYNSSENRFYAIMGYSARDQAYFSYFDASQTTNTGSGYTLNTTIVNTNFNTYMSNVTGGSNFSGHYLWNLEAIDTNLVSIPYDNNSTRLYKAENGNLVYTGTAITVSSDNSAFPLGTNYRGVTPVGSASESTTNLPYANYNISTKVRTEGVEIT